MLDSVSILSGVLSVIFVAIGTLVGIRIAAKYFELKQRTFLFVGIYLIGLCEPWWPSATSFLIAILTNSDGLYTMPEVYFFIGNFFIPFTLTVWIIAFTDLLYKERQKLIVSLAVIFSIVFAIMFLFFLATEPSVIGVLQGPVDVDYTAWILVLLISIIGIVGVTGYLFARESLHAPDEVIQLKGKLILAGFMSYCIGALLDSAIPLNPITLPITRFILIFSAFLFYGGFILPDWLKNILIK